MINLKTYVPDKTTSIEMIWQFDSVNIKDDHLKKDIFPSINNDIIFISKPVYVENERINQPFLSPVLKSKKTINISPSTFLLGIRLKPTVTHFLIREDMSNLLQAPNFLCIFQRIRWFEQIEDIALSKSPFQEKARSIEKIFLKELGSTNQSTTRLVDYVLNEIRWRKDIQLSHLIRNTGYSQRWVEKKFLSKVGITLKEAVRIARFNRTIYAISRLANKNLTQVGLETGFYDQSHFIREFKYYASRTPKEFHRQCEAFDAIMSGEKFDSVQFY